MGARKNIYITIIFFMFLSLMQGVESFAAEHKVIMQNWLFNPDVLTITEGDRVTWVNEDNTMHNIYFLDKLPGAPSEADPEKIRIRKKFSLEFKKAGEYNYVCKNHRDYDMDGKIIVKKK